MDDRSSARKRPFPADGLVHHHVRAVGPKGDGGVADVERVRRGGIGADVDKLSRVGAYTYRLLFSDYCFGKYRGCFSHAESSRHSEKTQMFPIASLTLGSLKIGEALAEPRINGSLNIPRLRPSV